MALFLSVETCLWGPPVACGSGRPVCVWKECAPHCCWVAGSVAALQVTFVDNAEQVLCVSRFFYLLILSVTDCACGFAHFCLQFCQLSLHCFEDLYVAHPFKIILCESNPLSLYMSLSLFLVIFLALKCVIFAVKIATAALFSLVFPLYIFSRLLL